MKTRVSSHPSCVYVYADMPDNIDLIGTIEEFRGDEETVWVAYLSDCYKNPALNTATEVGRYDSVIKAAMVLAIAIEAAYGGEDAKTDA